jgi:hypothetical protein
MTKETMQDSLGVFWKGEEVEGLLVYAYWKGEVTTAPKFPSSSWPDDTVWDETKLYGESWTVWLWEIRLKSWPSEDNWGETVSRTLDYLINNGAAFAWCAVEGTFVDPPGLFDSQEMAIGIWACRSRKGISWGPPPLKGRFEYAPRKILNSLHAELLEPD